MPHVSGHYRNGRWVRPHYRRSTPRAVRSAGMIRVRGHRRDDGTYVRSHLRNAAPTPTPTSINSDWDWLGYLAMLLFVLCLIGAITQA
ncbi:hypothetical protein Aab01nite_67200 [Paractinoplanes abujensis]|uniref:Uncharacterized protein n=1 Tax=Paractinoplanes abujensis TaxID=882441 RepID=A0A7W7CVQ4_9ACTN|nr:hypothetical protein [Actinoplanes abujensis]GID23130.1 hypothetical protein Aab01nite_67200 [Actinoplanes abujensis]